MLFTSIFSGIGLLWDRQFGFLKETLVAPVPRLHIMIGHTLGGATDRDDPGHARAGRLPDRRIPAGAPVDAAARGAVHGADRRSSLPGLGTAIGSTLQNMQGFQLIMNFLVMPIFFLSGALFPLNNIPTALSIVTQARSADLRHRRPARRVHRPVAFRHGDRRDRLVRGRVGLPGAGRLVVLEDPGLTEVGGQTGSDPCLTPVSDRDSARLPPIK